jgi:hypothetical protein
VAAGKTNPNLPWLGSVWYTDEEGHVQQLPDSAMSWAARMLLRNATASHPQPLKTLNERNPARLTSTFTESGTASDSPYTCYRSPASGSAAWWRADVIPKQDLTQLVSCAANGGSCSCIGTVYYGPDGDWLAGVSKPSTSSLACTDATFDTTGGSANTCACS